MQRIDYFFNLGSPWAYVGFDAFHALAVRHNLEIVPHVVPVIEENGGIYSRNRPPARRAYWMEDLKRWAHLRGVKLEFEGRAALSDPAPAGRLVIAAYRDGQNWLPLARAFHQAFWSDAQNIADPDIRKTIVEQAGYDSASLEKAAGADATATYLEESRTFAAAAGIFGLPSYLIDETLFWGQDSLAFVERHLSGERLTA